MQMQISELIRSNIVQIMAADAKGRAYELLNLRALKFTPTSIIHIFQCMGKFDILCGSSNGTFKVQNIYKTHFPYIGGFNFYTTLKYKISTKYVQNIFSTLGFLKFHDDVGMLITSLAIYEGNHRITDTSFNVWVSLIFCVEVQMVPLKYKTSTKHISHILEDSIFIQRWSTKYLQNMYKIYFPHCVFLNFMMMLECSSHRWPFMRGIIGSPAPVNTPPIT